MRLDVRSPGRVAAPLPVCFQVHTSHEPVTEQEREDVVPPSALRTGYVDLDAVSELEKPGGPCPIPDDWIERRQHARGFDLPG